MGLSVASLNPISSVAYVTPKQQAYSISNESAVSSSYKESFKNTVTPQAVSSAPPVQYATARYEVSSTGLDANRRMSRAYNSIAAGFGGASTSYDRNMEASAYQTTGYGVDMYA